MEDKRMEEKVIEGVLWSEFFKKNILEFSVPFLLIIFWGRLFPILFKKRFVGIVKSYVYFAKAITYLILVIVLCIYFVQVEGAIETINIFTGFTFLFSAVEVVDNFLLLLEEIIDRTSISSEDIAKDTLAKQEKEMKELMSMLWNLERSIIPGRVSKSTICMIEKYHKYVWGKHFYEIDSILEGVVNKEFYLTDIVGKITAHPMILKIMRQESIRKEGKHSRKALSFNKQECEQFKELIKSAIECKRLYYKEKNRLLSEKHNLNMVK